MLINLKVKFRIVFNSVVGLIVENIMFLPLKDVSNQVRNHEDTDYDHVKILLLLFGSVSSQVRVSTGARLA